MIRKTITRFAALCAVGALALGSACAPGETVDNGNKGGEAPKEAQTVDPKEFKGETLSYLYFTDGPDEKATRDNIKRFEEKYEVTVNLEILAYSDLVSSLQARLSGGNAPDVVRLSGLGDFAADLLPLEQYLGSDYGDEFLDGPMLAARNGEGKMIGVPSDLTMNGPFVNVDQFEKAGVEIPSADKPWTWDEMIEAAKKVQQANGTPYAFAMDKSGHRLSTILSQYGTALLNNDGYSLDKDKASKALQPLLDMMNEGTMPKDFWLGAGSRYEGANEIFLAQDTPIYLSGSWQVGQFVENAEFNWTAAPNPCADECGGFPGGKFMGALAKGKNPQLAAEFVRFMNDEESQTHFAEVSGNLPTRKDLTEKGVKYDEKAQPSMEIFSEDLKKTPENGFEATSRPAFGAAGKALVEQLDKVVAGDKELSKALDELQPEVEGIVEEMGTW